MENLLMNLEKLHHDLVATRNPASEYIKKLIKEISQPGLSVDIINEKLKQIKAGSKIVDLSNFNTKQEMLWLAIWQEATDILKDEGRP
jgi:hypothetical protein